MSTLVSNPFSQIKPVKQYHRNGCWAACLEWWSRGIMGCSGITQYSLRKEGDIKTMYKSSAATGTKYKTNGSMYGTLETNELIGLLQQPRWGMQAHQTTNFNAADLQAKLARGPVFIGFFDLSGNTWHVNVICGYDASLSMAVVMEPKSGKFMDKAFSDFTANSMFNVLGWRN